ncbi:hypothetical protein ABPG77_010074 [Micractinium sp. CCAP 211/92]
MDGLVRHLRSGNIAVQLQILNSLESACKGSPVTSRAAAAAGAIPVLVRLLRSSSPRIQAVAAGAIYAMMQSAAELRSAIVAAGAVAPLVALLQSSHDGVKIAAACALDMLCIQSTEGTQEAAAAGGVPAAVQLLLASKCPAEVAAGSGIVPALVRVAGSSVDAGTLKYAALSFIYLAIGSPQGSQAIIEAGGADALLLLQKHTDSGVRGHAATAWAQLYVAAELQGAEEVLAAVEAAVGSAERVRSQPCVCAAEGCVATKGLKLCARCGTVRYCSPECQASHWPVHRRTCKSG